MTWRSSSGSIGADQGLGAECQNTPKRMWRNLFIGGLHMVSEPFRARTWGARGRARDQNYLHSRVRLLLSSKAETPLGSSGGCPYCLEGWEIPGLPLSDAMCQNTPKRMWRNLFIGGTKKKPTRLEVPLQHLGTANVLHLTSRDSAQHSEWGWLHCSTLVLQTHPQ